LSQILDSLTRRRRAEGREASRRPTAQGDAVLATLGYAPPPRTRGRNAGLLIGAVVVAIVAWIGWGALHDPDAPSHVPPASAGRPVQASSPAGAPVPDVSAARPGLEALADAEGSGAPGPSDVPGAPVPDDAPPAVPAIAMDTRPLTPAPPEFAARRVPAREPDPVPATPEPAAVPPPDLMAQALYHHRAGDFERALVAYRTLIQENELNAAAHNNLGLLYQQKQLLDDAARAFQRAIIIDARYGLAYNNYGVTLLRQGRPDGAAAQFRTALELEPRNVDALVNLALAEKAAGRGAEAKATLLRALGAAPRHAMAHYNLAVLHDDTGEHARALEHYRAFLEHAGTEHADRTADVRARIDALVAR
jgi:Tfp pilus assembly protein PilF